MKFQDKVAIITGSTKGIGKATAKLLAAEGAKVVIVGTTEEAGTAAAEEIRAGGGEAFFRKTDVTSGEDLDGLVQDTLGKYGRIDILVNNAGIGGSLANMDQITMEEWDKVLATNLTAPFQIMKRVIPVMAFAASMGDPPPIATIQSGSNFSIISAPFRTVSTEGSGSIPSMI